MLTVGYGDVGNFIYYYLFNYKKKKNKGPRNNYERLFTICFVVIACGIFAHVN